MPIFDPASLQRDVANLKQPAIVQKAQPQTPPSGIGISPYLAAVGGQAADVLSSLYKEGHGYREGNPLMSSNPALMIGEKAAVTLPSVLFMRHLAATGHPLGAKVLGYLVGGEGGAAAALNMSKPNR